ncbi:MAG TPA: FHA domain-containing protein [Ornithinibacter sp.]|nr:FHA domain-containing protein [Ornithinibacter sp.]
MSTFTCPKGHASTSSDYCDTCGVPIPASAAGTGSSPDLAAGSLTPDPPSVAAGAALDGDAGAGSGASGLQPCPNCASPHDAAALFCEACGYDFTTGTMPRPPDAPNGADVNAVAATGDDSQASLAPAIAVEWVAEVWVDPDWYEAQESEDPCPSPGLPGVVELTAKSVLIGRPSASRDIHPEIDCTGDSGVSRRQAQLTTDGQRWWVEDLQSSNGTYVGPASGPLPSDPVPPGQRRELSEDDRIYVGAWTRLVVRRATPEERGQ